MKTKIYYIGTQLEYYNESGTKWSIEGIYDTKEQAFKESEDEEFIVELNLNEKLPKELHDPEIFWWNIEGSIIDKKGNKI